MELSHWLRFRVQRTIHILFSGSGSLCSACCCWIHLLFRFERMHIDWLKTNRWFLFYVGIFDIWVARVCGGVFEKFWLIETGIGPQNPFIFIYTTQTIQRHKLVCYYYYYCAMVFRSICHRLVLLFTIIIHCVSCSNAVEEAQLGVTQATRKLLPFSSTSTAHTVCATLLYTASSLNATIKCFSLRFPFAAAVSS